MTYLIGFAMYDIYLNSQNDAWRFALGKDGARKLIVIGLNPSTATKEKSDTTVAKVAAVANQNGFDGFVMLNLYPVRSTDYNALSKNVDSVAFSENLHHVKNIIALQKSPVIWAAWGKNVHTRDYFVTAANELFKATTGNNVSWKHFGSLTNFGHPRHPSRLHYSWDFSDFDILKYVKTLNK